VVKDVLEAGGETLGAFAGAEWSVSPAIALKLEVRGTLIESSLGREPYQLGGVTVMAGFMYRVKAFGN
jgi:hypothetical protein